MTVPITNEPTHVDADGNTKPGAVDLRADITVDKIAEADAVTADFYANEPKRNRASALNPQISEPYSPLQTITFDALREYGESNPGTIDGETHLLFLRLANKVIEDIRTHPLYPMPDIDYYTSNTESRPIPDTILIAGLQYYYALQQSSEKIKLKQPEYFSRLNITLYNRLYGNGKIEIQPRK